MPAKLPAIVMEKLLKASGAKRVSESSKEELQKLLKTRIEEVSRKAMTFAKHAGRKTIKKEDIELAIDKL